jgi:hypothetical protein
MEPLESRRLLAIPGPDPFDIGPRVGPVEVAPMTSASASTAWQMSEVAAPPSQHPTRTLIREVEPNGSLASAQTLPSAPIVEVTGQLSPDDGMDMFRVPIAANARGVRLVMVMDSPPTGKSMQVSLFDGSGRSIGNRSIDPVSGRLTLDLVWTGVSPPTDLIVALGYDGQGAQARMEETYHLHLSTEPFNRPVARPDAPEHPSFLSPAGFAGTGASSLRGPAQPSVAVGPAPSLEKGDSAPGRVPGSVSRPKVVATHPFPILAPAPIGGLLALADEPTPVNDRHTPFPIAVPMPVGRLASGNDGHTDTQVASAPGGPAPKADGDRKGSNADALIIALQQAVDPGTHEGRPGSGKQEKESRTGWRLSLRTGMAVAATLAVGLLLPDLGVYHPTLTLRRPVSLHERGRRAPRRVHP